MSATGNPRVPNEAKGFGAGGFAKLPNELVERGILAHIRGSAWKVYLAILHATRTKTGTAGRPWIHWPAGAGFPGGRCQARRITWNATGSSRSAGPRSAGSPGGDTG